MPAERPVGGGVLVEQDSADRAGLWAYMGDGVAAYCADRGQERVKLGEVGEAEAGFVVGFC